ncbi:hypothetical protein BDW42DRAFT_178685 [Aspergillus taichungensis]|uniref:Uncharacterized protein n=1 Tax=Aspergillus taichungensis TaxID=482145 RepID=A0A2J5HHF8_9EURO|nr:hypothetical protein BDW42DRAFT_178685 [Aspergillus taichungensis]
MLALRDQENLVHAHQTVAAAKPLNQGARTLQPKTPGARAPKTPFKIPLNDENDPLAFGKKTVKGTGKQKDNTKLSVKDAFATPMDTRQRAPLGMKTTNAKARGLQTPAAPGTMKPERTAKRASTQKVKKFTPLAEPTQPEVQAQPAPDDVPDIEYMPPKPKELLDIPDDITYDTTFPQFQPQNLALGLESVYGDNEVGEDGLTRRQRKFQEDSIAFDKMVDEMILKSVESIGFEDTPQATHPRKTRAQELPQRRTRATANKAKENSHTNISTVRARNAAAALSGTDRPTVRTRSAAMPKPKPRVASSMFASRKPRAPANPSPMRNTAAAARSRTTVGYTKGRDMSSKLHGPSQTAPEVLDSAGANILSPETYLLPSPAGSSLFDSEIPHVSQPDEGSLGPVEEEERLPTFEEDEEAQNFQLTL